MSKSEGGRPHTSPGIPDEQKYVRHSDLTAQLTAAQEKYADAQRLLVELSAENAGLREALADLVLDIESEYQYETAPFVAAKKLLASIPLSSVPVKDYEYWAADVRKSKSSAEAHCAVMRAPKKFHSRLKTEIYGAKP
jgi:hypothetical protein